MEFEVSYSLENEQQFWDELDDIVCTPCQSHEAIDNALRAYLSFTTNFKEEYLQSDYDIARCSYKLLESAIFTSNKDYVRRQIIYGLLQEDDAPTLHLIAAFLLFDGRGNDETFEMMRVEGVFPRLVELIQARQREQEPQLHRLLLELMYGMSRMQRLTWEDLSAVDDAFVLHLFQIIEQHSNDASDPYHYHVIRVLLVLNEQYLVASTVPPPPTTSPNPPRPPLTNRVIKALSTHGAHHKTFGENLILLLNRESETSLQLLILKLLYLLFQTPATAEYFYTNDLFVLLDVILRNLLDLPDDSDDHGGTTPVGALRHTYLRVLCPLLANSQIGRQGGGGGGGYKREETVKVLRSLARRQGAGWAHFRPLDGTTIRLAERCLRVPWLRAQEDAEINTNSNWGINGGGEGHGDGVVVVSPVEDDAAEEGERVAAMSESQISTANEGQRELLARRMLGMSQSTGGSELSVAAVAAQTERPGVLTPSKAEANATALSGSECIVFTSRGTDAQGASVCFAGVATAASKKHSLKHFVLRARSREDGTPLASRLEAVERLLIITEKALEKDGV